MLITTTFVFSLKANLNVGIPSAIWAITPLFVAFLEWVVKRTPLRMHHIVGMTLMLLGAVTTSLSQVLISTPTTNLASNLGANSEEFKQEVSQGEVNELLPIYVPILISFSLPITFSLFIYYIVYSITTLRVFSMSWTFAYYLIFSSVLGIASIVKFSTDPDFF